MNSYNVRCPVCGTVNHNLNLEETNGWMECEHCQQVMRAPFTEEKVLPVLTLQQVATCFAAAK